MKIVFTILTVLLATALILTSAIVMAVQGQASQSAQGSGSQNQTSQPQIGQTMNDVRQSRLVLLEGINNAILKLVQSTPGTSAAQFNTTHIAQILKKDQLCAAIVELTKLQTHVINAFGKEAASKEVVPQIQNLIAALKKQQPSAAVCG